MAVRDIVVIEHPVLRRKAKKIVKLTAEHRKLIEDMIETMRDAPGVGLAAPQVGVSERLIVVEYAEDDDEEDAPPKKKKLYVVLNPEIVAASEEMATGTEGCLSVPGWVGDVERHEAIVVRGLNRMAIRLRSRLKAGWRAFFSTRSIISTACCTSTNWCRRIRCGACRPAPKKKKSAGPRRSGRREKHDNVRDIPQTSARAAWLDAARSGRAGRAGSQFQLRV